MEMSRFKDVESGEAVADSIRVPLLNNNNESENVLAPTRPVGWLDSFRPQARLISGGTVVPPPRRATRKPPHSILPPRLPNPRAPNPTVLKLTMPPQRKISEGSSPGSSPSPPTTTVSGPAPRRWRRDDRMQRRLNTELLEAIEDKDDEEAEKVLNEGANPNATCRLDLVSACHMAALSGGECLSMLLKRGADRHRLDKLGRTPLHLAAWAGHARQLAELLDFPEDICIRVQDENMSSDAEEDVRKLCASTRQLANTPCQLGEVKALLPKEWKDNIDHNCLDIKGSLPLLQPGWSPLHVASARVRPHCTRLLLAAGADPNAKDVRGRTPLDVAGSAHYHHMDIDLIHFSTIVQLLLKAGGKKGTRVDYVDTPLHTATELESLDIMMKLLDAGYSPACLNEAGETPLHVCVRLQLEEPLQILANYVPMDFDPLKAVVDVKDKDGHTVLCAAIEAEWVIGVCIALEAGADVALEANDGDTPIHAAAILGNVDVLNEILSVAKQKDSIDCANACGETPLYKAVIAGHFECVKALLNEGASITKMLPGDVNVLHKACEYGQADILNELCKVDENITDKMINAMTAREKRGFGPIHFAAFYNHPKCLEILLSHGADVRLRTTCSPHRESTPLHIASVWGHPDIARIVLNYDKNTVHEVNGMGWFPLHSAAHHGKTEVIPLLLHAGADLSGYTDGPPKYKKTAIDMIVNNLSKPTEYLEELFDSYISTNKQNLQDVDCEVTVNYSILRPNNCEIEQMKVIEALLKTGNRYGQKRLLIHPLIESFLCLKWKALLPFFYTIIACYAFFVLSLTIFVVSVFFYADSNENRPKWLNVRAWGYVVYISISLLLLQELLYMNVKSSRYFFKVETWVKFGSIGLAVVLPGALRVTISSAADWPRHVATLAILLGWTELMFLLSRFPNWGYYVLMFAKVAVNVVKILLTFAFLVIGFSLSFMIEFRSQMPFESPWAAFVKTMVMMTSEFDYEALFDEEHTKELTVSIVIVRIIFVIFLVLAAIVLMNLMVGVAVNDITDLEIQGNIQRLAKQVEFLGTLDILVYNKFYMKVLPRKMNERVRKKRNVSHNLVLYPGKPRWRFSKVLPSTLRDAIFAKATKQKKQNDEEIAIKEFKAILNDIHKKVVNDEKKSEGDLKKSQENVRFTEQRKRHDDVVKYLEDLDEAVIEIKEKISVNETHKENVEKILIRVDQLNLDIENIKECLSRLESKLGAP